MFIETPTPTAAAPPLAVPEVDLAAGLSERRRRALAEAVTEATAARVSDPDSWEPAIALRRYGRGCLAVALAGTFDRAGTERVRALGRDLARLATTELVMDLSRLTACDAPLIRALLGLRMQHLVAGVRVELRGPPAALVAELGAGSAESYTVPRRPGAYARPATAP
jgi:hypothetical protein